MQAACSISRRTLFVSSKENRLLNEFFLYVLEDLHTGQGLGNLRFTSDDPDFVQSTVERVYPLILATATASEMPATMAFSRELVAYITAFLPAAPYFRANDIRVAGVCNDQYTATLERLQETNDGNFKNYMTSFKNYVTPRTVPVPGMLWHFRRGRLPRPRGSP